MNVHDHIALGALFHDIGKFWERAEHLGDYRHNETWRELDCPKNQKGGYRSHLHVLHTRRFCEVLAEHVSFLRPAEAQRTSSATDHWVNLAVRHHVPSSPLEYLIVAADHFASAEREQGSFYEKRIHQRTQLESILERISLSGSARSTHHRLPLAVLSTEGADIFPKLSEAFVPPLERTSTEHGEAWLSSNVLTADYQELADGFLHALADLPRYERETPAALRSLISTALAQMERFLSCVPAATNVLHPDISLYDHLRVTAAIAEGLYLHHEAAGTLDNSDRFANRDVAKWRLVCGDFSGIQDFIYNITSKGAAKGLRGRSLYIQLLCDGVSEHLLQRLGLYPTARIYSSGGKFYLLIPDCREQALRQAVAEINRALIERFQGKVFLGIGIAEVCGHDFGGDRQMGPRWKEANEALLRDRLQRFRPLAERSATFFAPQALHSGPPCGVCGRDDTNADIRLDDSPICHQCRSLRNLGKALADANYLFWVWREDQEQAREPLKGEFQFDLLPGLDCTLYLLEKTPAIGELRRLENSRLEVLNRVTSPGGNPNGYACGFRFIGKWERGKISGDWEFDEFADNAANIKRLGVLRLDVDNLGDIFIRGLLFPGVTGREKEMGSLSRVATLSRQLNLFFAGHLGRLLDDYLRTQIIYAGGDDVFIIGSWDELPSVAARIRERFQSYCADNSTFSLSGGIALVNGKYPISRAAELAGAAEDAAKALKRNQSEKNALNFLDASVGWEEFPHADKLRALIVAIIDKTGNRAILSRLRNVVLAVEEFERCSRQTTLADEEFRQLLYWQKWRWQLVYNLERLTKRYPDLQAEITELIATITETRMAQGRPAIEWLQLPVRWAEYLTRRET